MMYTYILYSVIDRYLVQIGGVYAHVQLAIVYMYTSLHIHVQLVSVHMYSSLHTHVQLVSVYMYSSLQLHVQTTTFRVELKYYYVFY